MRIYFHIPYRQTEGIIKATVKNLPIHPCYLQFCRRVSKLAISNMRSDDDGNNDDKEVIIAIDSSHIKEVLSLKIAISKS